MVNRCFICREGEEKVVHLLIHCSTVKGLWELLLAIVGFSWVFRSLLERLCFLAMVPFWARSEWPLSAFFGLFGLKGTILFSTMWIFLLLG